MIDAMVEVGSGNGELESKDQETYKNVYFTNDQNMERGYLLDVV
jgi:hypothetical protein